MPNQPLMPYRSLGKCGTKVSSLSLGGWTTFGGSVHDERSIKEILTRAFELGINFFDIADIYAKGQCEIEMGKVLKNFPRNELVMSSKVYFPISDDINDRGLSRKHIFEAVHKSLKHLGTDYLDIYFCHRFDTETPLLETARAMSDLVSQGKILYWGTSQWTAAQLEECFKICREHNLYTPQVEQPEYNLLSRQHVEKNLRPFTQKNGMGMVTWSPLASGLLTGKYSGEVIPGNSRFAHIAWLKDKLFTAHNIATADKLVTIAKQLDLKASQLALAWLLAQPGVSSVILGVTQKEQLEENLKSLKVKLSQETINELDKVFVP